MTDIALWLIYIYNIKTEAFSLIQIFVMGFKQIYFIFQNQMSYRIQKAKKLKLQNLIESCLGELSSI